MTTQNNDNNQQSNFRKTFTPMETLKQMRENNRKRFEERRKENELVERITRRVEENISKKKR